jgi:hypothetical protein
MSRQIKERMNRAALAGALVLLSQAALGDESQVSMRAPEIVRVTLPHDWTAFASPTQFVDSRSHFDALVEALDKSVALDLARQVEALGASRTELAIAEVPTRG